ncbi:P-loop containing nucleoside triphosphate hydrolase protein, partial [Aureobasidium melanogenum]
MPFMSSAVAPPPVTMSQSLGKEATNNIFMEDSDSDDEMPLPQQQADPEPVQIQAQPLSNTQQPPALELPTQSQTSQQSQTQSQPPDLGLSLFAKRTIHNPLISSFKTPTTTKVAIHTSSGKTFSVRKKQNEEALSTERLAASRSEVTEGRAQRSYYGIDIHNLVKEAKAQQVIDQAEAERKAAMPSIEPALPSDGPQKSQRTLMWTEKYRARKFTELVGDDRTHRSVMHWLKRWDEIVFPGSSRKPKHRKNAEHAEQERPHRKVLLLTGPPGLGKTTLAHVCAKQAGYEVQEINASDERSRDVVKGRIRDMVGTENVRGVDQKTASGKIRKAGKPVCVIVDEVDGVVGGSGGAGEGGFIKALLDLVALDTRNSNKTRSQQSFGKKKADNFRLLRPLILICNDVYHPSLRPLRQSTAAEVIHVRKPAISSVVSRMQSIFEKENVPHDSDGVRKLCEASWGMSSRKEGGSGSSTGEGDIRGILVVGEWIAGRLRATHDPVANSMQRLTRRWIEDNILADLSHGGGSARGVGRGGPKEVVERVFKEGAGFSKPSMLAAPTTTASITGMKGVAESGKRQAMDRLREMVNTSGDIDRIMTDCFSAYPDHPYQDDNYLSKPDEAYEWLNFHDQLSSAVFSHSEWELATYLAQPILAFHHLFATPNRSQNATANKWNEDTTEDNEPPTPFSGPQASYQAHETQKSNFEILQTLQASLSLPLLRMFPSPTAMSTEFVPYLTRMLNPNISPVVVQNSGVSTASVRKASEKLLVQRAVNAMTASGIRFDRIRLESEGTSHSGPQTYVYRMEPAIDCISVFETLDTKAAGLAPVDRTRFAVRQVLDQEFAVAAKKSAEAARVNRGIGATITSLDEVVAGAAVPSLASEDSRKLKRDFFGRIIVEEEQRQGDAEEEDGESAAKKKKAKMEDGGDKERVWVTFHEGYSNAVRKPVSLKELLGAM